jgi:hypothetical protein
MSKVYRQEILYQIFGCSEFPEVNEQSLLAFREHLVSSLEYPCFFMLADEDGASFEALKLLDFIDHVDLQKGLCVRVLRGSDRQIFTIPLVELVCLEDDSVNSPLIDAYCLWMSRSVLDKIRLA